MYTKYSNDFTDEYDCQSNQFQRRFSQNIESPTKDLQQYPMANESNTT